MTGARLLTLAGVTVLATCCNGEAPTAPVPTPSFLAGTWRGTITIQRADQPPSTAPTTWTFAAVPQTQNQGFTATLHSEHPWLPISTTITATIAPSATAPTELGAQGGYASPRGCRGTLGSLGTAEATRIEATFHGVDCETTFDGHVSLTKDGIR